VGQPAEHSPNTQDGDQDERRERQARPAQSAAPRGTDMILLPIAHRSAKIPLVIVLRRIRTFGANRASSVGLKGSAGAKRAEFLALGPIRLLQT
jgi:hypothetical protein